MIHINLLVIRTEKPEELSQFYEKLGLRFHYHQHGNGVWHYSAELHDLVFEIYPLMKGQATADNSLRLGFTVHNLDKLIQDLKKNRVEIINEPVKSEYGYVAVVKDLDGRKIELKEKSSG